LAYYFVHREQILNELREDEEFVQKLRQQTGPGLLEQRLAAARDNDAEFRPRQTLRLTEQP
jgi:hypothetical protein